MNWAFIDDMIGGFDGSVGSCWKHHRRNSSAGGCFVLEVLN